MSDSCGYTAQNDIKYCIKYVRPRTPDVWHCPCNFYRSPDLSNKLSFFLNLPPTPKLLQQFTVILSSYDNTRMVSGVHENTSFCKDKRLITRDRFKRNGQNGNRKGR